MYGGIVQATVPVTQIEDRPGLRTIRVELTEELSRGLAVGASVSLDGVCLTVSGLERNVVSFEAMAETQSRTTLGTLRDGDRVNVERSLKAGDEVGGHEISGHVDGTAEVVTVERPENNHVLTLRAPRRAMPYLFPKGFIALNGASLTVVDVDREACTFTVHLIPETLRATTFADKRPGDRVNFEIDRRTQIIVDTVRAFLEERATEGAIG